MPNQTLSQVLVLLLGALALAAAFLAYQYVRETQRANFWQSQITAVDLREKRLRAMLAGAVELGRSDPAIFEALRRSGIQVSNVPAATPAAAR
ncbi:MAG TPA: hypothetical protein PKE47_00825 [Verrucomicrobiota bacterium]|nr:hypothetical protein [Verrucomicrobiota bacterium]